jgi:hypothetical protein
LGFWSGYNVATIYRNLQKQKAKQKRSLPGKKRGFLQKRS